MTVIDIAALIAGAGAVLLGCFEGTGRDPDEPAPSRFSRLLFIAVGFSLIFFEMNRVFFDLP